MGREVRIVILVDVEVPVLDKTYDMQLDEYTPAAFLVEDIVGMICQKEQLVISGRMENAMLWHKRGQRLIERDRSLRDYQITSGETLILI